MGDGVGDECKYSVEARLAVLETLLQEKIQANRERTNEKFEAAQEALNIQTNEIARRLSDLNGEAGRLREIQSRYIPREVFDARFDELSKSIRNVENFQNNLTGRIAAIGIFGFIISGILSALVVRWILT